jgi:hypothetical protein
MRFLSPLLAVLLSFQIAVPANAFANADDPIDLYDLTPQEKKIACATNFMPSNEVHQRIRDSLETLKTEKSSAYHRAIFAVFGKTIRKRVLDLCVDARSCSPKQILRSTESEVEKVFGGVRSAGGYAILLSMQAAVYAVVFQVTKHTGGSVAATLIARDVLGRFVDHLQSPQNYLIDPIVRRFAQKMAGRGEKVVSAKVNNPALSEKARLVRQVYTDAERDGISHLLNAQRDQGNKVSLMQGYFDQSRMPESLSPGEQDELAQMLGAMFFQQRHYHAHLAPSDPDYNRLFVPYVRPLAKWVAYEPIMSKVWTVIDSAEKDLARSAGKNTYSRIDAQKYYEELLDEWFFKALDPIKGRRSLTEL